MTTPPPPPNLSPQFCFHPRLLRDFLRLSRGSIDDTISTHLNALLTPSTTSPFDPASTTSIISPSKPRRPIPRRTCDTFLSDILYPTWSTRDHVLRYCSAIATSPDPDDPEQVARETELLTAASRVVDERLDPYSARYFPREPRTQRLGTLLQNEQAVEKIVRERTWATVSERCQNAEMGETTWEEGLKRWRDRSRR